MPGYRRKPRRGPGTSGPSTPTQGHEDKLLRTAEVLATRGLDVVLLPDAGVTVEIRIPRTQQAIEEGLFPLRLALVDLDKMDPDHRKAALDDADRCARKTICACSISPRFVDRKARGPKFDEMRVDALTPGDFALLYRRCLSLIERAFGPIEKTVSEAEERGKKALATACARFGVDPTVAASWPVTRSQALLDYFLSLSDGKEK